MRGGGDGRRADLPLVRLVRVGVADGAVDNLDGRQQRVQAAREDGLAGAAAAGDGDTAELVVDGAEEECLLDIVHAHDSREGVRAGEPRGGVVLKADWAIVQVYRD